MSEGFYDRKTGQWWDQVIERREAGDDNTAFDIARDLIIELDERAGRASAIGTVPAPVVLKVIEAAVAVSLAGNKLLDDGRAVFDTAGNAYQLAAENDLWLLENVIKKRKVSLEAWDQRSQKMHQIGRTVLDLNGEYRTASADYAEALKLLAEAVSALQELGATTNTAGAAPRKEPRS